MDLYQTGLAIHPNTFYTGVVLVKGTDGESRRRANTIASEVGVAVNEELHHLVSSEQYRIPGFVVQRVSGQSGGSSDPGVAKPTFQAELKVCAVRADGALALRQDVLDKHMKAIEEIADKDLREQLDEIISKHNKAAEDQAEGCTSPVAGLSPIHSGSLIRAPPIPPIPRESVISR